MEFDNAIREREAITNEREEAFQIKDDPDEGEIKYGNTQYYLEIGEMLISETSRAPPDVTTSPDIKQEVKEFEVPVEECITYEKEEDLQIKDDPDQKDIKYVNTQDYLYKTTNKTVISEPNRAAPDVNISPGNNMHRICMMENTNERATEMNKCDICDHQNTRNSLIDFKKDRKIRTGEKPYKCEICDYCAVQSSDLRSQALSNEKPYTCEICDYRAPQKWHFKRHMRTHSREKPYKCEVCDYRSAEMSSLKKHIRIHSNEKPYKCEICDYRTAQPSDLRIHIMRTHSKERPYKCEICDYRAAQTGDLKKHVKTHTKERPYKCEICDYRAAHNSTLKIHMRTHSKEKPYKCEVCDYRAAQTGDLKKHIVRKHSNVQR